MSEVKLVIIKGPNYQHHSLGLFDLEIVPRVEELIFYENEGDDGPTGYRVMKVIHHIKPRSPALIWIVSLDDEIYHKP